MGGKPNRWSRQFGEVPRDACGLHVALRLQVRQAIGGPAALVLEKLHLLAPQVVELSAALEPPAEAAWRAGWRSWARAALLEGAGPAHFLAKAPLHGSHARP